MRKWVIEVGIALGIAFGAILIFVGSFFFILGMWRALLAHGGLYELPYLVMLFGGSMLAAGIIVVVEGVKRKWITAMRIASSATLIFFGLFLFSGVLISVIIGGFLVIAGIIIPLRMSPGVEMGGRKKRVATYFMIVVTVVWVVALCLHIQAYNRYRQDTIEKYIAMGFDEEFVRDYVDFYPILAWQFGGYLVISAFAIFIAWLIVLAIPKRADTSKLE